MQAAFLDVHTRRGGEEVCRIQMKVGFATNTEPTPSDYRCMRRANGRAHIRAGCPSEAVG